jgi:hypothetical protein
MRPVHENNQSVLEAMAVRGETTGREVGKWSDFDFFSLHDKGFWKNFLRDTYRDYSLRSLFTSCVSWSVPSREAVETIVEFCDGMPVREFMAGTAYWSYFLNQAGLEVKPTDFKSDKRYSVTEVATFVPVRGADVRKQSHKMGTVSMFSWVPYESRAIDNFLLNMPRGEKLVYIGEGYMGCTAAESTYEILQEQFSGQSLNIPQFSGINDYVQLCVKK